MGVRVVGWVLASRTEMVPAVMMAVVEDGTILIRDPAGNGKTDHFWTAWKERSSYVSLATMVVTQYEREDFDIAAGPAEMTLAESLAVEPHSWRADIYYDAAMLPLMNELGVVLEPVAVSLT